MATELIDGVTELSIESESNKQELNVQQNSLNSAYKTESIIFLKSYSPTVTHDKIFVYDFRVLWITV